MGITNAALAAITTALGTTFYTAVGTGSTAFAKTDTTLGTEVAASGLSRAAATVTQQTTTASDDTLQAVKAFSVSGTVTVAEVGLFDNSSGGTMYSRTVLTSSRAVVSGDTLTVTIKIIFA